MSREGVHAKFGRHSETKRDEKMLELFAWVQEYANLCRVLCCCNSQDVDTYGRLREMVRESSCRGGEMAEALSDHFGASELEPSAFPIGGAPRVLQPLQLPRVSGSQRFVERQGLSKLAFAGAITSQEPPKELLPSRDYTKGTRK